MVNTQILRPQFEYLEPRSLEEALMLIQARGPQAKILAGGTDLLVQMKMERVQPSCLISLAKVPGLDDLAAGPGLRVGALATFRQLAVSPAVRKKYPALAEAARSVSSVQIQNMGTLGGNLCHASPAADSAPPLIAFGAQVLIAGAGGRRTIPLEDFFTGPGKTCLSPPEVLVEIQVPEWPARTGSAFLKLARVSADLAKASAAAVIEREGEICRECRIALGAVFATPLRARQAERVLRGKPFTADLAEEAGRQAEEEVRPITDLRSTSWYRREVSRVLVRRALHLAWERAGQG